MTFSVLTGLVGPVVVAMRGDLDISSVPAVRERLLSLLRPGACRLVIDVSAVRYADASGLAVLVSTQPVHLNGYRDHIDRYLVPSIGRITLADLTGKRLQACFTSSPASAPGTER